jgi:hypothetical protein
MLPPPLGREGVTLLAAAENKRITQKKRVSTEPKEQKNQHTLYYSRLFPFFIPAEIFKQDFCFVLGPASFAAGLDDERDSFFQRDIFPFLLA